MTHTTLEEVITAARTLPPEDQRRLREWLEEQERHSSDSKAEAVEKDEERFQRAMTWLRENQAQYVGQWVALDGDRLVSFGKDGKQVYAQAKAAGVEVPLLEHIVEDGLPFGGW
jgi:hypothetical protein